MKYKLPGRTKSVVETGAVQHEYHKWPEQNCRNVHPNATFFEQ
jgi:hypothetical protein